MTVAISVNLSDGVVLGVDSAVTLPDQSGNAAKIYENAEKLFQLGERPIGLATFGMATLGTRSLGSYVREFEVRDENAVVSGATSVEEVTEALRAFFMGNYINTVVPLLEKELGIPYVQMPLEKRPAFGLIVGGFSSGAYLGETWQIFVPMNEAPGTAQCLRKQGDFGSNWFAIHQPIFRYSKGYDQDLMGEVRTFYEGLRGAALDPTEEQNLQAILNKYEYPIPIQAMPTEEGVQYARFLVDLVVKHHRFALGAPVVGGSVRIGRVTYKGERFEILTG
jgi:hypothetical protein